jgi:leader peptidase (prepilin peptidase) / N-methyltransferase
VFSQFKFLYEFYPWVFSGFFFIFGTLIGSFLNVCIDRIPQNKSVVRPGSHCACGKGIVWYDNIPVLSWFILKGKARCCGMRLSFRYPSVEFLTGLLFFICWVIFIPSKAICGMIFCVILICASFIDFDHMIIPERFSIGGAIAGVVLSFAFPCLHDCSGGIFFLDSLSSGGSAILGILVGSGTVFWIRELSSVILRKEAMGYGDISFMGTIGAFCGWQGGLFAIFCGAMIGLLGIILIELFGLFFKGSIINTNKEAGVVLGIRVPFCPMLAIGCLLYFFFLNDYVDSYLKEVSVLFIKG